MINLNCRSLILVLVALSSIGCGGSSKRPATDDRDVIISSLRTTLSLQNQRIDSLTEALTRATETDEYYYRTAAEHREVKRYSEANRWLQSLTAKFPKSDLIEKARRLSNQLREEESNDVLDQAKSLSTGEKYSASDNLLDRIDREFSGTKAASQTKGLRAKNASGFSKFQEESSKYGNDLELLSWNWSISYGYATAQGQVKNISGRRLENVEAVVTFKSASGEYISHSEALLDYNPIMPGQTSPFKVMENENPLMKTATIEFKYLMGGTIPTYQKRK